MKLGHCRLYATAVRATYQSDGSNSGKTFFAVVRLGIAVSGVKVAILLIV